MPNYTEYSCFICGNLWYEKNKNDKNNKNIEDEKELKEILKTMALPEKTDSIVPITHKNKSNKKSKNKTKKYVKPHLTKFFTEV